MIPDKLLINLKIISKIQKNGRIARSYDGIISLETDVFYQAVKRFITSDSRRQAIFEINSVITECIEILNHILNSKYMNKNFYQTVEYVKNCENVSLILTEMEHARGGIENLKFTYQNDPNIVSQIDIIILKINTTFKDVYNKLQYFESFLPQPQQTQQYVYTNVHVNHEAGSSNLASTSYQNSIHELQSVKVEGNEISDEEQSEASE